MNKIIKSVTVLTLTMISVSLTAQRATMGIDDSNNFERDSIFILIVGGIILLVLVVGLAPQVYESNKKQKAEEIRMKERAENLQMEREMEREMEKARKWWELIEPMKPFDENNWKKSYIASGRKYLINKKD